MTYSPPTLRAAFIAVDCASERRKFIVGDKGRLKFRSYTAWTGTLPATMRSYYGAEQILRRKKEFLQERALSQNGFLSLDGDRQWMDELIVVDYR